MVVVFLLRGLHNEAGNTKFRNVRQYIAHMGHVGGSNCLNDINYALAISLMFRIVH